jgi:hypothetical protein
MGPRGRCLRALCFAAAFSCSDVKVVALGDLPETAAPTQREQAVRDVAGGSARAPAVSASPTASEAAGDVFEPVDAAVGGQSAGTLTDAGRVVAADASRSGDDVDDADDESDEGDAGEESDDEPDAPDEPGTD